VQLYVPSAPSPLPFYAQSPLRGLRPFFKSATFSAVLDPSMPPTLFGEINLRERPFRIRINPHQVGHRRDLSTVHEAMHALNKLYKWNMNHSTLHMASDVILTEVLPLLMAQRKTTAQLQ